MPYSFNPFSGNLDFYKSPDPIVFGTYGAPLSVSPSVGLVDGTSFSSTAHEQVIFIEANAFGENVISDNEFIPNHTMIGAKIFIVGCNADSTFLMQANSQNNVFNINYDAIIGYDTLFEAVWLGVSWFILRS